MARLGRCPEDRYGRGGQGCVEGRRACTLLKDSTTDTKRMTFLPFEEVVDLAVNLINSVKSYLKLRALNNTNKRFLNLYDPGLMYYHGAL